MKKEGRVTLVCIKTISHGIIDRFTVVVSEKSKSEAKMRYKAMGYEVKEMEQ